MATKLKRSQSERVYRQRPDINEEAVTKIDNWQGVKKAWPPDENKDKSDNRDQATRNLIRRFLSYLLKKLRGKRKERLMDLNPEDIVQDLARLETEEGGSDESIYYSVSSDMNEENAALKKELMQKNEENEALRQRIKKLEKERRLYYTTNKGGLVFNETTCVNINIGEESKSSKKMEE